MASAPTVMVSSTFYDLRQIRADLAEFITKKLGYVPLLSEFLSFPIDPDLDTIDNCRRRVEVNADILVLVIGGRYGSIDDKTDKSITNLEYETARHKQIPVYVFVEKQILSILPVWKKNPLGDFSGAVDTPRLFEFIEQVRSQEKVWASPFETAQDIVAVLQVQFAHLFLESLKLRLKLNGAGLPSYFTTLQPQALRIILERPTGWEYKLFLQTWLDAVNQRADLIREYEAALVIGAAESVPAAAAVAWFQTLLHELQSFVKSATHLVQVSIPKAFGAPGDSGNPEAICWISKMLGQILEQMLQWTQRIRRAHVEQPFQEVAAEFARFTEDMVERLQNFPEESLTSLQKTLLLATPENPQKLTMTLIFNLSNQDGFNRALEKARQNYDRSSR